MPKTKSRQKIKPTCIYCNRHPSIKKRMAGVDVFFCSKCYKNNFGATPKQNKYWHKSNPISPRDAQILGNYIESGFRVMGEIINQAGEKYKKASDKFRNDSGNFVNEIQKAMYMGKDVMLRGIDSIPKSGDVIGKGGSLKENPASRKQWEDALTDEIEAIRHYDKMMKKSRGDTKKVLGRIKSDESKHLDRLLTYYPYHTNPSLFKYPKIDTKDLTWITLHGNRIGIYSRPILVDKKTGKIKLFPEAQLKKYYDTGQVPNYDKRKYKYHEYGYPIIAPKWYRWFYTTPIDVKIKQCVSVCPECGRGLHYAGAKYESIYPQFRGKKICAVHGDVDYLIEGKMKRMEYDD